LNRIQRRRKDLRLIIASATLDAEVFKNFFETNTTGDPLKDTAIIMSIEGRTFPVDIHYLQRKTEDYMDTVLTTVVDIHRLQPPGDILIFLTGQEEIDKMVSVIKEKAPMYVFFIFF
jgi:ATP-dependent RNA helicase DDX35